MLKSLASVFELREGSISKVTLRRILVLMILSLPTFPLVVLDMSGFLTNPVVKNIVFVAVIIGAIATVCFMSTRFVNRFYFPDKYLDEWEINIKHKSMAFTFMIMFWIVPFVILALALFVGPDAILSGELVFYWGMGFLIALGYVQIFHALWQVRPIDED